MIARALRIALLATGIVLAPCAAAADGSSGEVTLAREQFERGVAAASASRWVEAREAFERAYKLRPHPTTLLNLAGAEAETGRVVEAAEHYRQVIRDPAVTSEQRAAAERALARVERRAARVRFVVDGESQAALRLELDANALSSAAIGEDLPVDPGEHTVVLRRGGVEVARRSFSVREAEATTISLTPAPESPREVRAREPADEHPREGGGGLLASPWFWTAVGVVVVGGAAATICAAGACSGGSAAHPATGNAGPNVRLP